MAKKKKAASKRAPRKKTAPALVMPDFSTFDLQGSADLGHRRNLELADQLGRQWGSSTALPLEMSLAAREKRMPWGILTLDWVTGGIVLEKINRLWGVKSSLKSTLCLRAVRQAQNHCRHCKTALVRNPTCMCHVQDDLVLRGHDFGDLVCPVLTARAAGDQEARCVDCRCGKPRWWLVNKDDYGWLPSELAILVSQGFIPPGIIKGVQEGRDMGLPNGVLSAGLEMVEHSRLGKVALPYVVCEPPPHAYFTKDGKKRQKAPDPRKVFLGPDTRCEPMRCLYLDSEGSLSLWWAKQNGVDARNVLGIGAGWAEKNIAITEKAVLEGEHDLIVIDSTSMLESEKNIEKEFGAHPVVAKHANLMGSFVKRHVAACFEDGLAQRYRPTVLLTSQATIKGIGSYHTWLGPTGGNVMSHGLALDIRLKPLGYVFDTTGTFALRGDFEFEVTKTKADRGSPGATGVIRFWVCSLGEKQVGDSDDLDNVMVYARSFGAGYMLNGSGRKALTLYSDYVSSGEVCFQRVGDAHRYLEDHPTIYDDLRARVLKRLREESKPKMPSKQELQTASYS